jgi:hypothetical protein
MRAPLRNHDALYRGFTDGAWFVCASIDAEVILESTTSEDPVDAGTVVAQPLSQRSADAPIKLTHFLGCQCVGGSKGVKACTVERLIGVDVSHAGKEALIQQQRL